MDSCRMDRAYAEFIELNKNMNLEDMRGIFENKMKLMRKFKKIGKDSRLLEIGPGLGWFMVLCEKEGIRCKGLEKVPQLAEHIREFGRRNGVEPDVASGKIEDADLGDSEYDVVFAFSVFEHVEKWREGIAKIYNALKPGGLLYFGSTNRFGLSKGEFSFPLYGWLPDRLRYRLRMRFDREDIMDYGIDFNQFTYPGLRRYFRECGFSEIHDPFDILGPDDLFEPKEWKKAVLRVGRRIKAARHLFLTFSPATEFICIK